MSTTFKTSRDFAAPPEAVFAAFSSPERLARWWGPAGFRNSFETFDFRPGGLWRFTMHGPDGRDYANESRFEAITPGREVVLDHICEPRFRLAITLEPLASGMTRVEWEQVFQSAEVAAAVRHIVEPANEQNLDRWQAEVGTTGG